MSDRISKEARSRNMSAVKSVSKLEDKISKDLWRKNLRYRRNEKSLYGRPDFSIKKYKIVVFIDSCFWHNCPIHGKIPKNNSGFWEKKLNRNVDRDKEVTDYYLSNGWNILRIWEHELKEDYEQAINKILAFVVNVKG
ncbi:very short patch repair endonuclease [Virgibacillus siamensis]|uniref:very short patch repair endonuclease n=1 Tax=Virgibacillus siamensis TaxID=480071 RepID=UPI0009875506|nr:very short patch repair endonuclease [Virgibacillus siamensis]